MSLRFRLNLMITLIMLIIIGMGTLFVIHNARRSVLEEVQSSVNMALQLIGSGLTHAQGDQASMMTWLAELAHLEKTRHLRIHLKQLPETIFKLDTPEQEPEETRAPPWFSWLVTPDRMVGEKQVENGGGPPIHILVEANPEDEIAEAWGEAEDFLYLMIALAVSVYLLVYFMLGRAFRSVGIILQGLEGIEHGDFERHLPSFSLPEFDRISETFNHTAQALAAARDENRALTQQSLSIQEEERRYLARELHDELGQSLSAIKLMAASLRKPLGNGKGGEAVEAIIEVCDRLFAVIRSMMRRLRPMLLDELGLVASLEDLTGGWQERNPGVALDFHCDGAVEACAGSTRIHLFRIVQECLTNVLKHAEARHVRVRLNLTEIRQRRWIELEVSDDGRGFDPEQPRAGFGLLGMRERVASLGGRWTLRTRPGAGVSIIVTVPCTRETHKP